MPKLLEELLYDLRFVRSHRLQLGWYKLLKIFILLGFLIGYWYLYGWLKTALFLAVFMFLSLVVHVLYRFKTNKYTQSWLDFVVVEEDNKNQAKSIGIFYYAAIVLNAMIAFLISQLIGEW